MKKFFSLVLALVMTMSLATVAWGADEVTVGDAASGAIHQDLADAITAAGDGGTVKVLSDISFNSAISITQSVTIKADAPVVITSNVTGNADAIAVTNGTLTLGENVTITSTNGAVLWAEGGKIIINGATVNVTGGTYSAACAKGNGSTIELVSGSINQSGVDKVTVSIKGTGASLIMSGGAVTSADSSAIVAYEGGKATISGTAVVTAKLAAAYACDNGEVLVTGGKLSTTDSAHALIASNTYGATGGKVTVKGGTVDGVLAWEDENSKATIEGGNITGPVGKAAGATVTITGGTFEDAASAEPFLADGLELTTTGVVVSSSAYDEFDTKDAKTMAVKGTKALELVPAKDAYVATATGNWVGGWVKHYVDEYGVTYVPCTNDVDGALYLYYKGTTSVYDIVVAANPFYDAVATEFTNFGTGCGQLDNRANTASKYYSVVDGNGVKYLLQGTTVSAAQLMVDGKLVPVIDANVINQLNDHKWVVAKNAKNEIESAKCSLCGQPASWVRNMASVPAGAEFEAAPGGGYLYWNATPAGGASTDKTVTSADTFDAGIAMYVGMSVMAAAGSAVVLKKKD